MQTRETLTKDTRCTETTLNNTQFYDSVRDISHLNSLILMLFIPLCPVCYKIHTTPSYTTLYYELCRVVSCCVVLCCVVLCCVVLCCVVLCCVVLCYAMLCYVMSCRVFYRYSCEGTPDGGRNSDRNRQVINNT